MVAFKVIQSGSGDGETLRGSVQRHDHAHRHPDFDPGPPVVDVDVDHFLSRGSIDGVNVPVFHNLHIQRAGISETGQVERLFKGGASAGTKGRKQRGQIWEAGVAIPIDVAFGRIPTSEQRDEIGESR